MECTHLKSGASNWPANLLLFYIYSKCHVLSLKYEHLGFYFFKWNILSSFLESFVYVYICTYVCFLMVKKIERVWGQGREKASYPHEE